LSATNNELSSVPEVSIKLCYISSFSLQQTVAVLTPLPNISKAYLSKALQIIKASLHDGSFKKTNSKDCEEINHYTVPPKSTIINPLAPNDAHEALQGA
jgi:hypothetical protein